VGPPAAELITLVFDYILVVKGISLLQPNI